MFKKPCISFFLYIIVYVFWYSCTVTDKTGKCCVVQTRPCSLHPPVKKMNFSPFEKVFFFDLVVQRTAHFIVIDTTDRPWRAFDVGKNESQLLSRLDNTEYFLFFRSTNRMTRFLWRSRVIPQGVADDFFLPTKCTGVCWGQTNGQWRVFFIIVVSILLTYILLFPKHDPVRTPYARCHG